MPPDIINARKPASNTPPWLSSPWFMAAAAIAYVVMWMVAAGLVLGFTYLAVKYVVIPLIAVIMTIVIIATLFSVIAYIGHRLFVRQGHKGAIEMLKGLVGLTKKIKAIPQNEDTASQKAAPQEDAEQHAIPQEATPHE